MKKSKSVWIWKEGKAEADEYVQFRSAFFWNGYGKVVLQISADSDYMFFIGGKFVSSGQYQDYPTHKVKDAVEITEFLEKGNNNIAVLVWYYGKDSMIYTKGKAGLWYEITAEGSILDCSGEKVLCRLAPDYCNHRQQILTPQLGFNYAYDFRGKDAWMTAELQELEGFSPAVQVVGRGNLYGRPVKKLTIDSRTEGVVIQQGVFIEGKGKYESQKMDSSFMAFRKAEELCAFKEMDGQRVYRTAEECSGVYLIFDLMKERCGFLDFCIQTEPGVKVCIGYGEHLSDGRVRCAPGNRNFVFEFISDGKEDCFFNAFRRLGVRYIQLFVYAKEIRIIWLGIRPCYYPLYIKQYENKNYLRKQIYNISLETLRLCMHDHYEDCPWREQALYTTDSRNQMLAGYYAFEEYEFPKACLELMLRGSCYDGFMNICFPAGYREVIPFFTLTFFIEAEEYLKYSGDRDFFKVHYNDLKTMIEKHLDRMQDNHLVLNFINKSNRRKYWNFYEWKPILNGNSLNDVESYDVILNAFLSMALQSMAKISQAMERPDDMHRYSYIAEEINHAIKEVFYDSDRKIFLAYKGKFENCVSVFANSACVLCGAADGIDCSSIENLLTAYDLEKETGSSELNFLVKKEDIRVYENGKPIACSLSMMTYVFDALLKIDRKKYAGYILNRIDETYYYMISKGATTFWETLAGDTDFDAAGSLCHGWSAVPVYYYHILNTQR